MVFRGDAILLALHKAGGKLVYHKLPNFPDVFLSDYAALEAEGYVRYDCGLYFLTEDGQVEVTQALKRAA